MADQSAFKRGQIAGARMAGSSVTKTAELFGVVRSTPHWSKTGRKRKISDRDRQTLRRIVRDDQRNTDRKITAELNDHLENLVSSEIVRRLLYKVFHSSMFD